MASRFTKPDPSIKKNVLRSRAAARKSNRAHASVVVSSLAATVIAWALFTNQDAQALQAAQRTNVAQAPITIVAPAQSTPTVQVSATQLPAKSAIDDPVR